ncbi:MAG: hypothetical protein H5U17_05995 [Defluviimonas sp.]|nr:hypothetical protein [Defluviimonas sp.]
MKSPLPTFLLAGLPIVLLAACAQDPGLVGVPGIREEEAHEVAACSYRSTITMTPGLYGPLLAEQGLRYARNKVKEDALAAGANTVVFEKVTPGSDVYQISAAAYRC